LTQQQIGEEVGLVKSSVSNKIDEMMDFFNKCSDITESDIPNKLRFLYDKYKVCSEFYPFLYNIWNVSSINNSKLCNLSLKNEYFIPISEFGFSSKIAIFSIISSILELRYFLYFLL